MPASAWTLDPHSAQLHCGALDAKVELARPDRGLHDLRYAGNFLPSARLLMVAFPGDSPDSPATVADRFVRGNDLAASYRESPRWPVEVDVRWRAEPVEPREGVLAAVEAIVSVHTPQRDTEPELQVETRYPAAKILRLTDSASATFAPVAFSSSRPTALDAAGPRCVLFRVDDGGPSYVQMLTPADSSQDEVLGTESAGQLPGVRHRLFPRHLEKGVILRVRVLGALLVGSDDAITAAALYRDFSAAEPPLGA